MATKPNTDLRTIRCLIVCQAHSTMGWPSALRGSCREDAFEVMQPLSKSCLMDEAKHGNVLPHRQWREPDMYTSLDFVYTSIPHKSSLYRIESL